MTEGEKALLAGRMRCGPYKDKEKDQIQRHWILACARMTEGEKAGKDRGGQDGDDRGGKGEDDRGGKSEDDRKGKNGAVSGPHEMRPLQQEKRRGTT